MDMKEQIHGLTDEMLTNLGRLVAIDSQLGTPAEGMPFGEGPAKALEEGLKIAEELGFKTVNLDNYCGYAEMGEGEEIVGIAGHLDIVPVGGDWTYDPFKLTREGDYVYGRGTTDAINCSIYQKSWFVFKIHLYWCCRYSSSGYWHVIKGIPYSIWIAYYCYVFYP